MLRGVLVPDFRTVWTKLPSESSIGEKRTMKRKRFTDEQIAMALRQAEGSTPVADVCRQILSEASFYV